MFASNAFQGKLIATTVNVPLINTSFLSSARIGTSAAAGSNLYIEGNLFVSDTITVGQGLNLQSIYYGEDLARRGIHLLPSSSNSSAILSYISTVCNAASQTGPSFWAVSPTPVYANATYTTGDYFGSVLLPDGRVVFVPADTNDIGIYNPYTNEFSKVVPPGLPTGSVKYRGGVLCPNGNVAFVPYGA